MQDEEDEIRRLFGTESEEDLENQNEGNHKGVHWDQNVVEHQKGDNPKKVPVTAKRRNTFHQ